MRSVFQLTISCRNSIEVNVVSSSQSFDGCSLYLALGVDNMTV